MGDHLAISRGTFTGPLNPLITDVSRGPPGLSGGPGPLGPHRNSTTAFNNLFTAGHVAAKPAEDIAC